MAYRDARLHIPRPLRDPSPPVMNLRVYAAALLGSLPILGCQEATTAPKPPIIARVQLTAPRTTLGTGDTLRMTAVALDSAGRVVRGARFSWSTGDALLATVDTGGLVHALAKGTAHVEATATGPAESIQGVVSGSIDLDLRQIITRVQILVPVNMATGDTVTLKAVAYDAMNVEMPQATIAWSSSDSLVATVKASNTMIGRAIGRATLTARATDSGVSVVATNLVVVRLVFSTLVSGTVHNCGIARGGVVHCWGEGAWGRLGTGVSYGAWNSVTTPQAAIVSDRFASLTGDEQHDSRSGHTCGVSSSGKAYCWGSGAWGMLGDGQHGEGSIAPYFNAFPTALTDIASAKQVVAGAAHTCVLDGAGAAYCAGGDGFHQIGVDTVPDMCDQPPYPQPCSTHFMLVQGGHVFASLASGGYHTCGLTSAGQAWCWGDNGLGELGAPTTDYFSKAPVLVAGMQFTSLVGGEFHTCGLDTQGVLYCWGGDWFGQLGSGQSGSAGNKSTPTRVTTLQHFASVYAGGMHSCALAADGVAYCWGENAAGQLGFTTTEMCGDPGPNTVIEPCATTPQAVNTDLRFVSLGLGSNHTCGLTSEGAVYCWGGNERGQLGDGTIASRTGLVRVVDTK
jgi:alpha-tubulin suppressor-like RCC1 family protein